MKFAQKITELASWLDRDGNAPCWSSVLVLEDPNFDFGIRSTVPRDRFQTVEQYEQRFAELLGKGFNWINVSAFSLYNSFLIVRIEFPRVEGILPEDKVPIMYSGPWCDSQGNPIWDISNTFKIE